MCGIAGIYNIKRQVYPNLVQHLEVMNRLQQHRGVDDHGIWYKDGKFLGLAHRRLSIIDLNKGSQPMRDQVHSNVIVYNGEIYNYIELREELKGYHYYFNTTSDTEVILASYYKWGKDCVNHFKGMFAFAIWDEKEKELFCARDKFGIKPFYYYQKGDIFYFASEVKALLPFLSHLEADTDALKDYLVFQLHLEGKTLYKGVNELKQAHTLTISDSKIEIEKYWEIFYNIDTYHTSKYFEEELMSLIYKSVCMHMRSDVEIGSYLSGGTDSSIISIIASKHNFKQLKAFTGRFSEEMYDETEYARYVAKENNMLWYEEEITPAMFIANINKIIYHLDYPVAGIGSFAQYQTSKLASRYVKTVLSGVGGDEIFGGYVRYLIAYFEQVIKGAIDDTLDNGNFVVTYESIIPNLKYLQNYKPLLKKFFSNEMFEDLNKRYFKLINRGDYEGEIKYNELYNNYSPFETFKEIFDSPNIGKESYFDKMTHFDFKTLLPALLHVEDRMSMANGIETRVPFLDSDIIELTATIPADIKFKDGKLKNILLRCTDNILPDMVKNRKNKMGFPVPLNKWIKNELKDFVIDTFSVGKKKQRQYFNYDKIINNIFTEKDFSRKTWGLLSIELWYQEFYDKQTYFKNLIK